MTYTHVLTYTGSIGNNFDSKLIKDLFVTNSRNHE